MTKTKDKKTLIKLSKITRTNG